MSSLALLMQNYSDSEGDSSDEERKSKQQKIREDVVESQKDSKKDMKNNDNYELDSSQSSDESDSNKLQKDQSSRSYEITPTLEQMKLHKKLIEDPEKEKQTIGYQDYLEDDFCTLSNNELNDEMNDDNNSDASIIDEDSHQNNEADSLLPSGKDERVEKLNCSQYSPRSFHRLLIGLDEQDIQIPDAPNKPCSDELTQNVINYHNKMKQGVNMNKSIQDRKNFRNPSIYEKLISFCNIDEFGTNLPSEIFDPDLFREKEPHKHDTST